MLTTMSKVDGYAWFAHLWIQYVCANGVHSVWVFVCSMVSVTASSFHAQTGRLGLGFGMARAPDECTQSIQPIVCGDHKHCRTISLQNSYIEMDGYANYIMSLRTIVWLIVCVRSNDRQIIHSSRRRHWQNSMHPFTVNLSAQSLMMNQQWLCCCVCLSTDSRRHRKGCYVIHLDAVLFGCSEDSVAVSCSSFCIRQSTIHIPCIHNAHNVIRMFARKCRAGISVLVYVRWWWITFLVRKSDKLTVC